MSMIVIGIAIGIALLTQTSILIKHPYPSSEEQQEQDSSASRLFLIRAEHVNVVIKLFASTSLWCGAQLVRSLSPLGGDGAWSNKVEHFAWTIWEEEESRNKSSSSAGNHNTITDSHNKNNTNSKLFLKSIPTLRLSQCDGDGDERFGGSRRTTHQQTVDEGHTHLLSSHSPFARQCMDWTKDIHSQPHNKDSDSDHHTMHMHAQAQLLLKQKGIDLSKPLFLPNIWNHANANQGGGSESEATATGNTNTNTREIMTRSAVVPLSIEDLASDPLGDLLIPYFTDASKRHALKPDAMAPLRDIVHNITTTADTQSSSGNGGPQKIGTQMIVERYPHLILKVAPTEIVTALFGDRFQPHHLQSSLLTGPARTVVPIFLARGRNSPFPDTSEPDNNGSDNNGSDNTEPDAADNTEPDITEPDTLSIRTDLHCEPIGNVAVQLHGRKLWTLVDPEHFRRMRPSVSKHGRAFFYSGLDLDAAGGTGGGMRDNHTHPFQQLQIPYYQVITHEGDALWVPPWTWHRVDYLPGPGSVSLAASLFHVRPWEFMRNQPLFALLILPNLIKEFLGRV
jgi:hypothetical protein